MKKVKQHNLYLGQQVSIKSSVFEKNLRICYAGQCSERVFSIVVLQTYGNNSLAYNLYFNEDTETIEMLYGSIKVISADARKIEFTYALHSN